MILNNILDIIIILLILASIVAMLATVIGFIRLPDEMTKIHAAGVTGSFAVELVLIAGFVYFYRYLHVFEFKFFLAIAFLFLAAPVSAHMISISAIIYNKHVYSKITGFTSRSFLNINFNTFISAFNNSIKNIKINFIHL